MIARDYPNDDGNSDSGSSDASSTDDEDSDGGRRRGWRKRKRDRETFFDDFLESEFKKRRKVIKLTHKLFFIKFS